MSISKISPNLSVADWTKKVGAADKSIGVATQLKDLNSQHADLLKQDLGTSGLSTAQDVRDRIAEIEGAFAKTAEGVAKKAKAIADAIKKNDAALKKVGSDAGKLAATALTAANDLASEVSKAGPAAVNALNTLLGKLEAQEKKDQQAVAAKAAKEAEEKESEDEDNPKLPGHNAKVKQLINKLRAGSLPPTLFAFAQNNIKEPYSKGKEWGEKSLMAVGPKASKSFRTQFVKLLGTDKFKFFFGEIKFETEGKDKSKFILLFESPLANSKAIKDALLYQCGFSPKFQLRKNTGEVVEEAGEGEEEQAEEATEQGAPKGGADPLVQRLTALKAAVAAARGPTAAQIKTAYDKAVDFLRNGDPTKAKPLLDWAEAQLKAPAGGTATAGAGSAETAPAGNGAATPLGTARAAWSTARKAAVKGIKDLADQIEREYSGETEQQDAVGKAAKRLRSLADELSEQLEAELQAALDAKADARAARVATAKQTLGKVVTMVTKDDVMKTIDGNELVPSMSIVAPMRQRLAEVARALG